MENYNPNNSAYEPVPLEEMDINYMIVRGAIRNHRDF